MNARDTVAREQHIRRRLACALELDDCSAKRGLTCLANRRPAAVAVRMRDVRVERRVRSH